MVVQVRGMPPFCITKREVTRIKAAQPFILMVVQMGSTKRATRGSTPSRSSALCIVTGSVAALLFVKRAIKTAGIIARSACNGLMPRANRNRGSTTKNCNALPPRMTATYLPSEAKATPAESWEESWAEKATMPKGNVQISQRISRKSNS